MEAVLRGRAAADGAHALLEALGALNRERLLPLIEQVFDEFDREGEVLRFDRIDLDLGRFDRLEPDEIEARLGARLRDALRGAVPRPGRNSFLRLAPSGVALARPAGERLVEAFEHYLLRGAWPYGGGLDPRASPAGLFAQLLEEEPAALLTMLRRRARTDPLLRRLVRQMPERLLARLLQRLDPESAGWILAYMAETRSAHAEAPLVPEPPAAFGRTLWTLVLRDALNRAGLRANRRSFVARLVDDLAAEAGVAAADLLRQLQVGLEAVPSTGRGDGSLLSILAEIGRMEEDVPGRNAAFERFARLAEAAGPLGPASAEALKRALWSAPVETRLLLHRLLAERDGSFLARLAAALPAEPLLRLILGGDDGAAWAGPGEGAAGASAGGADGSLLPILAGVGTMEEDGTGGAAALERFARLAARRGPLGPDGTEAFHEALRSAPAETRLLLHRMLAEAAAGAAARISLGDDSTAPAFRPLAALLAAPGVPDRRAVQAALAFADAHADPPALRRFLRRHLIADAPRLLRRLGTPGRAAETAALLLPPHLAEALSSFIRLAGASPEEFEALIVDAARLPASAPAALLARRLFETLATSRRASPGQLALSLRRQALAAREAPQEALLGALRDLAGRPGDGRTAEGALLRKHRTAGALRLLIETGGAGAAGAAAADALASGVTALAAAPQDALRALVREGLGTASLRGRAGAGNPGDRAEAALRAEAVLYAFLRLDRTTLRRLVAILAPCGSDARAELRARLAEAATAPELAAIAAALALGQPLPAAPIPPPSQAPERQEDAADLAAVEAALASRGPPGMRARGAFARLLRRRPFDAVRLAAAANARGRGAAAALLADPFTAASLFATLPAREREEAQRLSARLAAAVSKGVVRGDRVAQALLAAALARTGSRGSAAGLAALWKVALLSLASAAETKALNLPMGTGAEKRGESASIRRSSPAPAPLEPGTLGWLLALASSGSERDLRRLRRALALPALRARMLDGLPPHVLLRILVAARPGEARALLAAGERLVGAGAFTSAQMWPALLETAGSAETGGAVAQLVEGRLEALGRGAAAIEDTLLRTLGHGADEAPLRAAIEGRRASRRRRSEVRPPAERRPKRPSATGLEAEGVEPDAEAKKEGEPIFVANGGLVLAGVYLPVLFERLGLLARDPAGRLGWRDAEAAGRGVHLLQYLVDGRCDAPEPLLALNKVLCGLDPAVPVAPEIEVTGEERKVCDGLLAAMVEGWPPLRGSSAAALQETFLQREGRLERTETGWKLEVERKVLDVLLDSLPWSFSIVFHPWMTEPLATTW